MFNVNHSHALQRYEFNRNPKSPYIYILSPLPAILVNSKGEVELVEVNSNLDYLTVREMSGKPRYCEWGVDVSNVELKYVKHIKRVVTFCRKDNCIDTLYTFYVFVDPSCVETSLEKAKMFAAKVLFPIYCNHLRRL